MTNLGWAYEVIDEQVARELASIDVEPTMRVVAEYAALVRVAERHLVECVAAGRHNGASWERIGQAIGVTKQAAQQRFGAK